MTYKEMCKLIKSFDAKTREGRKQLAVILNAEGYLKEYWTDIMLQDALEDCGVSASDLKCELSLISSAKMLIEKYGDVARKYIETFDKCTPILSDYIGVDSHWNQWHNDYARSFSDYKTLNQISVFGDTYDVTLELKDYDYYKEKYVRLSNCDTKAIELVTRIIMEKYQKEIEYRKKNAWKGAMDIDALAEQLQSLFPNIKISVRIGKRQNDGDCKPYKAIVVGEGIDQLGSMTLNIDHRGIGILTKRVPLCGESSCEVTNDNVLSSLKGAVEFMLN